MKLIIQTSEKELETLDMNEDMLENIVVDAVFEWLECEVDVEAEIDPSYYNIENKKN